MVDNSDGNPQPAAAVARPDGPFRILYVGRFDFAKAVDNFVEILRRLEGYAVGIVAGNFIVSKEEDHRAMLSNISCSNDTRRSVGSRSWSRSEDRNILCDAMRVFRLV